MRESGIILPSQRTLCDYSHAIRADPGMFLLCSRITLKCCFHPVIGFSKEVDHRPMDAAKIKTSKEWEKLVVILLDEMYIKENLVYDKHDGSSGRIC